MCLCVFPPGVRVSVCFFVSTRACVSVTFVVCGCTHVVSVCTFVWSLSVCWGVTVCGPVRPYVFLSLSVRVVCTYKRHVVSVCVCEYISVCRFVCYVRMCEFTCLGTFI